MKTLEKVLKAENGDKNLINKREMVLITKREYSKFLLYQKAIQRRNEEEADINEAIKIYKKEKKEKKLKKIKSLTELD